ncbi:MAG: PEP-CTERM sorting domain-containing protein [Nostoc sp.]|uniref:PEP-CTERM sorting domain-containing protein n=1 Tax=Nostoc sp. TaxID=1180 RepID=UPI002FF60465
MNKSIVFKSLNKIGIALTALTAIGFATTNSASAATVTTLLQDDFNQENNGVGTLNYNQFANFDVINGSVDLIGNGFFDFLPGNGLYVDLDGSTFLAGTLQSKTTFNFQPGDIVNLSFQLAGNQRNAMIDPVTVTLGNLFNETFSLPPSQGFTTISRSFTVASATSATLNFRETGTDNIGLLLDNVTLTKSVPEPGSIMGLLAFGAFGATSLCKRKQQQSATNA